MTLTHNTSRRFVGLPQRREKLRGICLHWTGGVRPPDGVFSTLKARGLSVHYGVGIDGSVWQYADDDRHCRHAGGVNAWTVGIEVVSAGFAHSPAHMLELDRGVSRIEYTDGIHGKRVSMLDFLPAQYDALGALLDELTARHDIPRRMPMDGGRLLARKLAPKELDAYSGVLGHYHASGDKCDPGSRPLETLRLRWSRV